MPQPNRSLAPPLRPILLAAVLLLAYLFMQSLAARAQQAYTAFLPAIIGRPAFAAIPFGADFDQVTAVTHADDARLFIVERAGRVKILHPDGRITLFLDAAARVLADAGEYGLYDLAFHPGYGDPASPGHGFFYLSYTGRHLGQVRFFVSRFQVSADPDAANPNSEAWLMKEEQDYSWHKGGELEFDPADAMLYVGLGDDKQPLEAQNTRSPKGKIVRLRVDAVPPAATGDATSYLSDEVWALGLRNPWRFHLDAATGQLYVGDVGEQRWEEINLMAVAGRYTNFGWPCLEGPFADPLFEEYAECDSAGGMAQPILAYDHSGGRCAVIAGKVYRPATNPHDGRFIYGDLCTRELSALARVGGQWASARLGALDTPDLLTTIGEDAAGNLYAGTAAAAGPIYRLFIP